MKIRYLAGAAIFSCIAYICVFLFFIQKPLTIGILKDYFSMKHNYLSQIKASKIVLLAGSNGRFSHRCETVEKEAAIPCANMSVVAGISLDFQLNQIKQYLRAGDLVYLPLEYDALNENRIQRSPATDIPYIVAYDKSHLMTLGPMHILNALFFFDINFLLSGIAEMALESFGIERRFSLDTMTPQGDESTHTREKGQLYADYLATIQQPVPDAFNTNSYTANAVSAFMQWATNNSVKIVGGLPTVFDDHQLPVKLLEDFCRFYVDNGHWFLLLDNKSQYPRGEFFDGPYHLVEEAQIAHTLHTIPQLAAIFHNKISGNTCVQ